MEAGCDGSEAFHAVCAGAEAVGNGVTSVRVVGEGVEIVCQQFRQCWNYRRPSLCLRPRCRRLRRCRVDLAVGDTIGSVGIVFGVIESVGDIIGAVVDIFDLSTTSTVAAVSIVPKSLPVSKADVAVGVVGDKVEPVTSVVDTVGLLPTVNMCRRHR